MKNVGLKISKRLQSFRGSTKQDTFGEKSDTKTSTDSAQYLTISLADLPLTTFIAISCYEKYELLSPTATKEQLQNCWARLMSEYYLAKEDKHSQKYLELVLTMRLIEYREIWVTFLCDSLTKLYSEKVADILRSEFRKFKFTIDSYLQDIQYVYNVERANKIKYDQCKKEYDALERSREKVSDNVTPKQKEHGFHRSVIGINSVLKSNYDVNTMNTLTYALLVREAEKIIEQSQNKP